MSKKKNRRQVRHQADTAGAREAQFEAELVRERAMAVKATGVINNAEAVALGVLQEAGWKVEWDAMEGGHGQPYAFLLTAPGACEQVIEGETAIGLIKAARELGTPDLYPMIEEYAVETEADPVLVNGYDGDPWMTCRVRAFHDAIATFHMSTKVIELPAACRLCGAREETTEAGLCRQCEDASRQVRVIEGAWSVYVSGRGDIIALAEDEDPHSVQGTVIDGSFIQVKECCEGLGMVWRQTGRIGGMFEYPLSTAEVDDTPANLFPHPATHGLFKTTPRGVGTDPISGALIAPLGKVFELTHQVKGLIHTQKTIRSAAWVAQGWTAQVVTL